MVNKMPIRSLFLKLWYFSHSLYYTVHGKISLFIFIQNCKGEFSLCVNCHSVNKYQYLSRNWNKTFSFIRNTKKKKVEYRRRITFVFDSIFSEIHCTLRESLLKKNSISLKLKICFKKIVIPHWLLSLFEKGLIT